MRSLTPQSLGERLEQERARRFVGRADELEVVSSRLAAAVQGTLPEPVEGAVFDMLRPHTDTGQPDLFSALWVHGPGGIGKSSLLRAYARAARAAGFSVAEVDCGRIMPSPDGIRAAVNDSFRSSAGANVQPSLIIIDSAERLGSAENWLREEFLPALPGDSVVVIGGRRPPDAAWLSDPGWHDLLRVILLDNLPAEHIRTLLEIEGISVGLLDQVMALTYGHPLAVSLLIDVIHRSGASMEVPKALADQPDLVAALLQRLVDLVPSSRHRVALQVSAHARVTTEPVLRAVLSSSDDQQVSELWDWLRDLTFIEDDHGGIRPHDLARDVLEADLRWRDPDAYAEMHRRLRRYLVDKIRAQAGNPERQHQGAAELLFLLHDHPLVGPYWDWHAPGESMRQPMEPDQAEMIIAMTRGAQGDQQAELAAHWLRAQPEAFRVFCTDGEVYGYAACLALHRARPKDIQVDPGAAAAWDYAQRHRPPRPGDQILAWRFHVERDANGRHRRRSGFMLAAWQVADILTRRATAWEFVVCYADLDYWQPFFNHWDFVHLPEADYQLDTVAYVTFGHDWRRVGVAEWLERTAARELGGQVAQAPTEAAPALSQAEFAASVKKALRTFHQPQTLMRNPLLTSSLVQTELRRHPDDRPDKVLRGLIHGAAQILKADPRSESHYRVLDRTYLRPAPSQEKAAELLDLPFSTYRRYRDRGIAAITEWLWDQDLDSTARTS
jgi:hypothetical protein